MEISTVFEYSGGGGLTVFLDPLTEGCRCFSDIGRLTPICLAFPVVDNVLVLVEWNFVFGEHEYGFEGVDSLETNLYSSVLKDPFVGLTPPWKIGD